MSHRLVIVGGPRTGKTTLALSLSDDAKCSDSVMGLGWSESSAEVAKWLDHPGAYIIEGVACVRALRKWLVANPHPKAKPCDTIFYLKKPYEELKQGQVSMAKGIETVWKEIEAELVERSVYICTDEESVRRSIASMDLVTQ